MIAKYHLIDRLTFVESHGKYYDFPQTYLLLLISDELSENIGLLAVEVEDNAIVKHGEQFADYLKKGLSDNWSQVRYRCTMMCTLIK